MRKRKKGSTFVIVIVVMAIIFTTGTAVLALTVNNYKVGINESKRLENLYKADSGLDIVENIIVNTSQEAIKYADNEVKSKLMNSESYISKDEINNIFKKEFYNFLTLKVKDVDIKEATKVISTGEETILEYLILNKQLIETTSKDNDRFTFKTKDLNLQEENYKLEVSEKVNNISENAIEIQNITISINSTFESTEGEFKNERNVSKTYTIEAPDYSSDIKTINIYPVFDEKAITADGNMNIKNSNINITGNIWIKGDDKNSNINSSFVYGKYNNGIKLNNSNLTINGDIYSNNTVSLTTNNKVAVNGNIYARNVYVGKENYGEVSINNKLNLSKDLVVNNDLAINTSESDTSNNSTINIEGNFYGINDKTDDSKISGSYENDKNIKRVLQSSSIIKNDYDNSTLNIEKDAYILGVAYLDALDESGKRYQTGESIAVKGNYLAYTDADVERVGKDITLKYYSPLQLVESIKGNDTLEEKAKYFTEYYSSEKTTNKYKFNYGGISINGNVKSIGASFNKESVVQADTITSEDNSIILNKRNDFAKNVFSMGDTTGIEDTSKLYINQIVEKTVSNQVKIEKSLDINKQSSDGSQIVVIRDGNVTISGEKKGLVIANGDVIIDGKVNFTGTIIATGDIIFKGTEEKNITYDGTLVRSIIAENYDILKDIFNSQSSKGKEIKINSSNEMYNPENFLKSSLWKIER